MECLYINNRKIDLGDRPITRKIQIGSISEVDKRKSSFSYTLKAPKTSNNIEILEFLGTNGNMSKTPFKKLSARYLINGVPVIRDGVAIVKSCDNDYSINLIDGVNDLSILLKDKKISELPLDDLNHILTTQNLVDSLSNTEGYIYGVADFGGGVSSTIKVERQAPSIFTSTIFRRIFSSAGLSLQGDFFDVNRKFNNEVVTISQGFDVDGSPFTTTNKGDIYSDTLSEYASYEEYTTFLRKFTISSTNIQNAIIESGNVKFTTAGNYEFILDIDYSTYKTFADIQFRINGETKSYIYLKQGNSQTISKTIIFYANAGDVISFYLSGSTDTREGKPYSINYSVDFEAPLNLLEGGQLIEPAKYLGDTSQLDFVKDVANRYGLILQPLKNSKDFEFKQIEVLLNDTKNIDDWTNKLSSIDNENYQSGYAQINRAKYNYDSEVVELVYDGEMDIDNKNAKIEGTLFSTFFEAPIKSANKVNNNEVFLIGLWENDEVSESAIKTTSIKRIDTEITYKLLDEVTGVTISENIPFLSMEDMYMDNYIHSNYRSFQNLINNYKKVNVKLNLSLLDIYKLDFFKLKYLLQTGRYYYLESVKYTANKVATATMIEINSFLSNQTPSQVGDFSFDMNHGTTRTITKENLLTGYSDPEDDAAYKVKILSGFNSDVLIKQDGVILTSATEILLDDLNLVVEDVSGVATSFSKNFIFTLSDVGSKEFSEDTGILTANILEYINYPPVADAGENRTITIGGSPYDILEGLNGSASYDNTGEIVKYEWEVTTRPTFSAAYIDDADTSTPEATFIIQNLEDNKGQYVIELVVTDEFGATGTDEIIININ